MRRLCAAVCIMATSGSVLSVWGGTYAEEFIGNRQGGEYPRTPGGCEDPAWCDSAGFLCEFDTLYRADGTPMSVVSARAHKGMAVVRFAGIDTPEQAEALRNTVLYMNRADVELDADTYFIRDLIGLQVLDADTGAVYGSWRRCWRPAPTMCIPFAPRRESSCCSLPSGTWWWKRIWSRGSCGSGRWRGCLTMRIDIATLFPELCEAVLSESILGRARASGAIEIHCHQIRDFAGNKHNRVDDVPYGGGMGMVMQAKPIYDCYQAVCAQLPRKPHTIYMSPKGTVFSQQKAISLCEYPYIFLLCGHYEGVDQRVLDKIVDEEISIGDYVLTGGELPALVVADAIARMCPGVLPSEECFQEESTTGDCWNIPLHPARGLGGGGGAAGAPVRASQAHCGLAFCTKSCSDGAAAAGSVPGVHGGASPGTPEAETEKEIGFCAHCIVSVVENYARC